VLCFAGRLELQKGIDVLLEALALLDGSDLAFDVVIHGSGRLERHVAAAVARLRRRVELLPPRLDLAGQLRSFDAILMPSRFEGLPMLAVEALVAGVPILATNAPGLDEALPDWYPGRCAVGDPAALAALISGFVRDLGRWRADAEVARTWARDRFSAATMIDRYLELYDVACGVAAGTSGPLPPAPAR
jgi:glycosyltransferase involved in cell wall biosynthesis